MFLLQLIASIFEIEILLLNFRALRLSISIIAQKQLEEQFPTWMYFNSEFLISSPFSQRHINSELEWALFRCGRESWLKNDCQEDM